MKVRLQDGWGSYKAKEVDVKVGMVVRAFSGRFRVVQCCEDIKNGRPGFDLISVADPTDKRWCYVDQVIDVEVD